MKHILLIAYYFEPYNGVGSKRMTYWANAFFAENAGCTVITATEQPSSRKNVIFVEDPKDHPLERFLHGISWGRCVKSMLQRRKLDFDFVIISGGPFGHFYLVSFLKRNFGCKVFLDYRDPLSGNPRFGQGYFINTTKRIFEAYVNKHADRILTVNDCCKELLAQLVHKDKITVIENGYDETIIDSTSPLDLPLPPGIHFLHAGKFYVDPSNFVSGVLDHNNAPANQKVFLHHIGVKDKRIDDFNSPYVIQHGEKSYTETVRLMKQVHAGFLITSGELLEYNTKIFDYIGCNLDIIMITQGEPETGCVNGLTSRVSERVTWVRNNRAEIGAALAAYRPSLKSIANRNHFSRRYGFERLRMLLTLPSDNLD